MASTMLVAVSGIYSFWRIIIDNVFSLFIIMIIIIIITIKIRIIMIITIMITITLK